MCPVNDCTLHKQNNIQFIISTSQHSMADPKTLVLNFCWVHKWNQLASLMLTCCSSLLDVIRSSTEIRGANQWEIERERERVWCCDLSNNKLLYQQAFTFQYWTLCYRHNASLFLLQDILSFFPHSLSWSKLLTL